MRKKTKTYRPRRTQEAWKQIIANFEKAGLAATTFCEEQDLSYQSFMKWRSTFKSNESSSKARFLEITPGNTHPCEAENSSGWDIELSLADNVILRIRRTG